MARYVTREQTERARELTALDYFQSREPGELVRNGSTEYRLRSNHSVAVSVNAARGWYDHATGEGGHSALDFLIKSRGVAFISAVEQLASAAPERAKTAMRQPETRSESAERKAFELPPPNLQNGKPSNRRVFAYLSSRGIDGEVINHHIKRGALYEKNSEHHNAVFVGFDAQGEARYAGLHGTNTYKRFVGEVGGSDKRYSFCEVGSGSDSVILVESAIDAISVQTLLKLKNRDWRAASVLSLSGVAVPHDGALPATLERFLSEHPDIRRGTLSLDNDEAGLTATERLKNLLTEKGYDVTVRLPNFGKDINDELQDYVSASRQNRTKQKSAPER